MQKQKIILLVLLAIAILTVLFLLKTKVVKHTPKYKQVSSVTSPLSQNFKNWGVFKNGYQIKIPPNWQNTSDRGGHVIFEPGKNGEKAASFKQISISVVSGPPDGKKLTTQEEFDSWYKMSNKIVTRDTLQKVNNTTIDSQPVVELIETIPSVSREDQWSLVAWLRKDNANYYINVRGFGKNPTIPDLKVFDYLIHSFSFPSQ